MLEKKPVLVLDEFAADQDPHFRRKFYLEILDYLKAEGFTVIAVTHDDHYYHYCDYLYTMESRRLEITGNPRQSAMHASIGAVPAPVNIEAV